MMCFVDDIVLDTEGKPFGYLAPHPMQTSLHARDSGKHTTTYCKHFFIIYVIIDITRVVQNTLKFFFFFFENRIIFFLRYRDKLLNRSFIKNRSCFYIDITDVFEAYYMLASGSSYRLVDRDILILNRARRGNFGDLKI